MIFATYILCFIRHPLPIIYPRAISGRRRRQKPAEAQVYPATLVGNGTRRAPSGVLPDREVHDAGQEAAIDMTNEGHNYLIISAVSKRYV